MCLFNVIIVVSTFIIYIYTPSFTVLELCITFCYFAPILKRAILYQSLSHASSQMCVCVCVCVWATVLHLFKQLTSTLTNNISYTFLIVPRQLFSEHQL